MRERGARWRLLRVLSEYSLSLTVTQTIVDPRGEPAVLCSGTGWVLGYPRGAHPRTPGPAVHRRGMTALHWAARRGNRRIVRSLAASGAVVNAQNRNGCAVCACGESAECAGRVAAAVGRAGRRRCTMPRSMAILHPSRSCGCAAPTGPSRPSTGNAALRRTAETETRKQPCARRDTPKRHAEDCGRLAQYAAGESQGHSRPPPHRPPPPLAAGADGCAVGARRRCSPSQLAGRRRSPRTVIDALAARFVLH